MARKEYGSKPCGARNHVQGGAPKTNPAGVTGKGDAPQTAQSAAQTGRKATNPTDPGKTTGYKVER